MKEDFKFVKSKNEGVIPLTKEECKYFEEYLYDYYELTHIIMYYIIYLLQSLGLVDEEGIHYSTIDNLNNLVIAIMESVPKHQLAVLDVIDRLKNNEKQISSQDIEILKDEFKEFPKKFKELVDKLITTIEALNEEIVTEIIQEIKEDLPIFMNISTCIYNFILDMERIGRIQ